LKRSAAYLLTGLALSVAGHASPASEPAQDLARHRQAEAQAKAQERADTARAAEFAEQQVQAAVALRRLEAATGAEAARLAALQTERAAAQARLAAAQAALARLLPVMLRLQAQPAGTLLAIPQSPADAVRGAAVLQGIAATIGNQAHSVQRRSAELAALSAREAAALGRLQAAVTAQSRAEAALTAQIAGAKAAEMAQADRALREAAASLAAQHKLDSITAAIARLAPRASGTALPPGAFLPVAGKVLQNFGAATLAGPAQGIRFSAAPGARVVTPCAGTVLFAGAFASYGEVVIADCGAGISVVLAGMHRLDVATGERLARGQPVGTLPGFAPAAPARLPVLYFELRRNGAPVDPGPWLAAAHSG
jgi:septal ring factor EnvC (AmiA/AmiB activator)